MRIRYIVLLLLTGCILSGVSLFFLTMNVAPGTSALMPILFTVLLFFFVLGVVSSALISMRSKGEKAWIAQFNLSVSIRQGIVIGALASICFWLARVNLLSFWLLLVLILLTAFLEYWLLPPAMRQD